MFYDIVSNDFHTGLYLSWMWNQEAKLILLFTFLDLESLCFHIK